MKLIIAGSRHITLKPQSIRIYINENKIEGINEVVSGGAKGIDRSGEVYAKLEGVKYKVFPADWSKYGKSAGPIRNRQMAEYADALLLVWDGESKGSASMKIEMQKLNKPIYEIKLLQLDEHKDNGVKQ